MVFLDEKWLTTTFLLCFCYLLVAFVASFQIGRIVYYKHKKFSYQSAFLLLCLAWAVLRAIYFLVVTPANQNAVWLSFIYWTPINIQFATFTLLVAYYASLVHPKWRDRDWKIALGLYIIFNGVFVIAVGVSLMWSVVDEQEGESPAELLVAYTQGFSGATFFVLVIVLGSYALLVFFKIRSSKIPTPFHIQGSPVSIVFANFVIVIIYISRSAYDIVTIFGYLRLGWSDDKAWQNGVIFVLYCLWELAPVSIVLFLFRRIPKTRLGALEGRNKLTDSEGAVVADNSYWSGEPRSLFDNEKRYDSGDDDDSAALMPSAASPHYGTPGSHMPYSTKPVYSTTPTAVNSS